MQDTFTYREIEEAINGAIVLGQMPVGQKTAYRLARIMTKLRSVKMDIEKSKVELYKQWGTESPGKKGEFKIADDKMEEFNKIFVEFMEQTIEVEYMPIACNMFAQLPAAAIVGMGKFMIEEEKIIT